MKKLRILFLISLTWSTCIVAEEAPNTEAVPSAEGESMVVDSASIPREEMTVTVPDPSNFLEQDFDAVINSTAPMTPEQIRRLKKILDDQQRAAAEPVKSTTPRSRQIVVDIAPGADMPVIAVNRGLVSTLVFLDRYGEPWPVSYFKPGNTRDYTVEEVSFDADKEEMVDMTNALTVSTSNYYEGNVSVFLKGMASPIVVYLKPGGDETDVRVDLRINKMGPSSARATALSASRNVDLPSYDSLMLSILGGVPPKGYQYKVLDGRLGDVFSGDERMFVRTHYKMISPTSKNMIKSADGTILYEIEDTSVVLMVIDGSVRRVQVK